MGTGLKNQEGYYYYFYHYSDLLTDDCISQC